MIYARRIYTSIKKLLKNFFVHPLNKWWTNHISISVIRHNRLSLLNEFNILETKCTVQPRQVRRKYSTFEMSIKF